MLPARDSWRVNTAHVSSFVLISILRGQPRTPPSGDNLGILDYHLNVQQNCEVNQDVNTFEKRWDICLKLYTHMFVCLFWIRNRICPTGSTPEGGPTESSPTTQATRHPRASLLFMSPIPPPPYLCHASCLRSVPSPVLLSCTYILTKYLVCPHPVFLSYTYI